MKLQVDFYARYDGARPQNTIVQTMLDPVNIRNYYQYMERNSWTVLSPGRVWLVKMSACRSGSYRVNPSLRAYIHPVLHATGMLLVAALVLPLSVQAACKEFKIVEYEDRVEAVCVGEPLTEAQKKAIQDEERRQEQEAQRQRAEQQSRDAEAAAASKAKADAQAAEELKRRSTPPATQPASQPATPLTQPGMKPFTQPLIQPATPSATQPVTPPVMPQKPVDMNPTFPRKF